MIHDVSLRSVSNSSSECLSERCSRYHHWETKQTTLLRSMSNKVPSSEVTKWILRSSHDSFVHFCDHSAGKTKAKHMENSLIFHVTIQIQILTMFSVQSKYSKKTKSISLLGFVISNKTCKTRNVQIRCQPSRLSSPRWKPNSLLPMQKRSNGFISPQMSHNFHTSPHQKRWRRDAHCHQRLKRWWCFHPSNHQDHARQTESSSYCTNDQAGCKRWATTRGEYSAPSRRSTHSSAAANSLPISASGQREVPTVATHRELAPVLHRCYRSTWGTRVPAEVVMNFTALSW